MLVLLSLLTFFLWTLCFSLSKIALQYTSPIFLTAFRMALSGILLISYLCLTKHPERKLQKQTYLPLMAFGFFSIYLTNILEFSGLQHVSAAKTCCLYSLTPFFTILLSYIHFGETITFRKCLGIFFAGASLIPVLLTQSGSEDLFRFSSFLSWPELAVIGAVFFSTYGWIILRLLVKNQTLSPLVINGYGMGFGSVLALTHFYYISPTYPMIQGSWADFLLPVFLITLISNLICYNLYSYLLKHLTATFLSFVGLLSPIFTSISSYFLLGEGISVEIICSSISMLFALFLVYSSEIQQGYIKSTKTPSIDSGS